MSFVRFRLALRALTAGALLASLALCSLTACFNPFDPRVGDPGITEPAPVPDSPENLMRLLEWCYENRATFEYREMFDNDYRFVFGLLDPDGEPYRTKPWNREDEVESTTNLFQGGDANQPAATNIVLIFDRTFRVTDDPDRPGRGHKLIRTSVTLRIVADQATKEVAGYANFFLVRGDSAAIPPELSDRGFEPDSNRWYILRHEDDTLPPEDASTAPLTRAAPVAQTPARAAFFDTQRYSWGGLKHAYR
ncbi:MAG TPA: hypothetical protein VFQ05_10570 [Candidatus Eisenbacteria bacterium]|nr:hypothetical protein [Candidatus Eisenbacteria bacterium]